MSNSLRLDYISCAACGKSVEYRIYNKHWAQSRGHRTAENPYPPEIHRPSRVEEVDLLQLDETITFEDQNGAMTADDGESRTADSVDASSESETQIERIAGAGTHNLRSTFDYRRAFHKWDILCAPLPEQSPVVGRNESYIERAVLPILWI